MLRLHDLLLAAATLSLFLGCQGGSPGAGDPRANSGGTSGSGGSGGAPLDGGGQTGGSPGTGGTARPGSGGVDGSSGGAGGASGGAPGTGGTTSGTGGTTSATGGTSGASGGNTEATGGSAAATGGASAAGGGAGAGGRPGQGGRGGGGMTATGGGGGGASTGGAAGAAGAGAAGSCPFTSAEHLLWSGVAPGSAGATVVERTTERSTNPQLRDRTIAGVTKPTLVPYLAAQPNGAAAVVLPGGGYSYLAWDKEGVDIALWLNSLGVSAFVLKYRLPNDLPGSTWVALADAQRAMRVIRKNSGTCRIDPARIGVVGFSAGGHLASQLETRFDSRPTPAADEIDAIDARPAFGVLIYPVISMDASITHAGSRTALLGASPTQATVTLHSSDLQVTSTTPATFIATSLRDTAVKPENSTRFRDALVTAGVAQELRLYQDGGHGTGIRGATGDMASWPAHCASWLATTKVLSGPVP